MMDMKKHGLFVLFSLVVLVAAVVHFFPEAVDESLYIISSSENSDDVFVASGEFSEEMFDEESEEILAYAYNGFRFAHNDGLWWTAVKMESRNEIVQIPLHYGAYDLTEIRFEGLLDSTFDDTENVYVAIDPTVSNKYYTVALSEMNFNLVKGIRRRPVAVCTEMAEGCEEREILSCENNPDNMPMIEFVLADNSNNEEAAEGEIMEAGRVEFEGNCVKIIGSDEEILKASDALILLWYGIL